MAKTNNEQERLAEKYSTFPTDKKKMLIALSLTGGIISVAAKQAQIHRSTHYIWYKDDLAYRAEYEAITGDLLDLVESKLLELINGAKREVVIKRRPTQEDPRMEEVIHVKDRPDNTSIIFYLKTKGKSRGYVEKQEVEHSGGVSIEPNVDLDFLSDDEKLLLAKIYNSKP